MNRKLKAVCIYVCIYVCGSLNTYAQQQHQLNPQQYAVLPLKLIALEGSKGAPAYKFKFTPDGDFLYMFYISQTKEGKLIIYDVKNRKAAKVFNIPKTDSYSNAFCINEQNNYQVAVVASRSEIIVLPDWRTEPDDAFAKQKPANSNRISLNWKLKHGAIQMGFSTDGKSLYTIDGSSTSNPITIYDLATGKTTTQKSPTGKPWAIGNTNRFLGDDEVFLLSAKSKKLHDNVADIYSIREKKIVRSYDIPGYKDEFNFTATSGRSESFSEQNNVTAPYMLCTAYGYALNMKNGYADAAGVKFYESFHDKNRKESANTYPVPNANGYVVIQQYFDSSISYGQKKLSGQEVTTTYTYSYALLFYDKEGKQVKGNFPAVNRENPWTSNQDLQISPNGKYMVFRHEDINDKSNNRLILATLY